MLIELWILSFFQLNLECKPLAAIDCSCISPPPDVDTPEPDEKSLITYVSSLYDIFPEPPHQHPLYDAVSAHSVSRDQPDRVSTSGHGNTTQAERRPGIPISPALQS